MSTGLTAVEGLVSTIIPVYNRAGMIRTAVESVLNQTYRPIEMILVDDGSTDGTFAELKRLECQHPEMIRTVIRENGGPGLARETGRQLARGEFIQYLDSDDMLLPRKFEVQVAALRAHPECDIAYGRSAVIDADGRTVQDPGKWTGRQLDFLFPELLVDRWWYTHTPLYRRTLCDRIGAWPAQRPEDWDYDARAGALHARLVFCDEKLSCQRQHAGHRVTKWSFEEYLDQEAQFLPRLYACAVQAGIGADAPETGHFSRWLFFHVRRAGLNGDSAQAEALLELAFKAAGGRGLDLKLYRIVCRAAGCRNASRWFERVRRLCGRPAGERSIPPSWSREEDR